MKVLLAMDFSPVSDRILRSCAEHDWPPGTVVRLLAIVENVPPSAAELWYDGAGDLQAVRRSRQEHAEELAQNAAAVLQRRGLQTEVAVRCGRRRKTIAAEADLWSADLVIDVGRGMPAALSAKR